MAKKAPTKSTAAAGKAPSKSQVFAGIAEAAELSKKQVAAVFAALNDMVQKNLGARGPQVFTIPGLCKMTVRKRPAQKPRQVRNPRTGEMMMSKAKPASKTVRVRALKALKEMV